MLDEFSEDFEDHYIALSEIDISRLYSQYIVGMSMDDKSNLLAWFNRKVSDSQPISLNLLHNAIVRAVLGTDHSIAVTNAPMTRKFEHKDYDFDKEATVYVILFVLSFTIPFICTFFVMFYIKERISKAKLLQLVSGLNTTTFWLSTFLFDYITYLLITAIPIIIYASCQKDISLTINEVLALTVMLVTFGIAVLPSLFVFSFLFTSPMTGLVWTIVLCTFPSKANAFEHALCTALY